MKLSFLSALVFIPAVAVAERPKAQPAPGPLPGPTPEWQAQYKRVDPAQQDPGCYEDFKFNERIFEVRGPTDDMSIEKCRDWCEANVIRPTHIGLESGRECWCTKKLNCYDVRAYQGFNCFLTTVTRTPDICNESCDGNPDQDCGGHWAYNLYKIGKYL